MKKALVLPVIAAAAVIAAVLIVLFIPKGQKGAASSVMARNGDGNLVIRTTDLSGERISFLRVGGDSKIEILARKGDDGKAKAALGTCQSCNGSPNAYYTQEGSLLKCNNCGLTFPLNVIDEPGGGCHPISIDPAAITETDDSLILDAQAISQYEPLFEGVAAH